jgi:simple sugar transport system permease protein
MAEHAQQFHTERWLQWGRMVLAPLVAVVAGLVIGSIIVLLQGQNLLAAYAALIRGAFGDQLAVSSTLTRAAPIVVTGLGTALAFKSGLFNLGGEGQFVLGALATAIVAIYVPLPPIVAPVVALMAGVLAGALWAAVAGVLEAHYGMSLLIVTLLQNYLAVLFAAYLVAAPLRDRSGAGALYQTRMVPTAARLAFIPGLQLHLGLLLGLLVVVAVALFLARTIKGFELRMMGLNPLFARYSGINTARQTVLAMSLSGAVIGLAGGIETLGVHYRYIEGALTVPQYAWTGLVAALMANSNPWGTLLAGVLLAALQTGASGMELATGVPYQLSNIIQAVIIIFVAARYGFGLLLARLEARR